MPSPLTPGRRFRIQRSVLAWYRANRRDLPWRVERGRPDAYRVLVSDAMLQQTPDSVAKIFKNVSHLSLCEIGPIGPIRLIGPIRISVPPAD